VSASPGAPGAPQLTIAFHGGAGTVTGSRHLLTAGDTRVLVDCGMFQGLKELRDLNWRPPAFDARSVTAMILTHAHMDHVGYIPRLARDGFAGNVYTTGATRELSGVVLKDSAKLQEEDAAHANRKGYSKHKPALPLYTSADVEAVMPRFSPLEYHNPLDLGGGVRAVVERGVLRAERGP
jgi:metallo-beta-lactamase family protein